MRRGRQAADDGSFARSVGVHTARGALLIAVAVVLGLVLLQSVDSGKGSTSVRTVTPTTVVRTTVPPSTSSTRPASAVKVLVANGTNTDGIGGRAQRAIAPGGYNVLAATDATVAAKSARRNTTVYYAAGFDADARKIAAMLGMNPAPPAAPMPTPLPVADLKGANVLVLVGPDFAAGSSTAATTVPPTTPTTRNL